MLTLTPLNSVNEEQERIAKEQVGILLSILVERISQKKEQGFLYREVTIEDTYFFRKLPTFEGLFEKTFEEEFKDDDFTVGVNFSKRMMFVMFCVNRDQMLKKNIRSCMADFLDEQGFIRTLLVPQRSTFPRGDDTIVFVKKI